MIEIDGFLALVIESILKGRSPNQAQLSGLNHSGDEALLLAAGPGSGKTTILVLRALRHVFVDGVLPEYILITTFTRKAARELRTRWLDWGTIIWNQLYEDSRNHEELNRIDLNRCRIDTLDSIAELSLSENKRPGEISPILIEGSASKILLKRQAFSHFYRSNKDILDNLFSRYTFEGDAPRNQGEALGVAKTICDRLVQDQVDLDAYAATSRAHELIVEILRKYQEYLRDANVFDFAILEQVFLERLRDGSLNNWLSEIKVLLIDEYQDTNPLQEAIYFTIISGSSPLTTVVGDDDQSMYRFRGGSVELFNQFHQRCLLATGKTSLRVNMIDNYRSSDEIVAFYNGFIIGDAGFSSARIHPTKPEVVANRGVLGMPVLGMFRSSPQELADSLAEWLKQLVVQRKQIISSDEEFEISLNEGNDLGDCVLIAHTIEEEKYNGFQHVTDTKFAGLFRKSMDERGLSLFNPRGRALRSIERVQQLLGLVLLCLDPDGSRTAEAFPTNEARYFLDVWRDVASGFIRANPAPGNLQGFVQEWQEASQGNPRAKFPDDWPVLELIFKLISWAPEFQSDPEHQVWLEAIARTVSTAGMASPYGMQIMRDGVHKDRSRSSLIRDALVPIAEDEVDVDEDILANVPRHRLQLMTIHQSKGLEFPLVIVDVGSQFTRNHAKQKFRRFPVQPSNVVNMEDDVEPFLASQLRTGRSPLDRAFDDLIRLYYVAYSRPQSVLMLVGCEKGLKYGREGSLTDGAIPNVALGWTRDGSWPWRQGYNGNRRPIEVDAPLFRI